MTELDPDFVTQAPDISDENLKDLLLKEFGISNVNVTRLIGYDDLNFQLENFEFAEGSNLKLQQCLKQTYGSLQAAKAILKFSNPVEARIFSLAEAQNNLMKVITENGIPCPQLLPFLDGSDWKLIDMHHENEDLTLCPVRLPLRMYTFQPGDVIEKFLILHPETSQREVFELIGRLLAHFHNICDANFSGGKGAETAKVFQEFFPLCSSKAWDFLKREFDTLCSMGLIDAQKAKLCQSVFDEFSDVIKIEDSLEQGVNHSDFNESNILLSNTTCMLKVSGLLDFGDAHWFPRIYDISSSIFYLILDFATRSSNSNQIDSDFLRAKLKEYSTYYLNEYAKHRIGGNLANERKYIGISMKSRLVASVIYSMHVVRIRYRKSADWDYITKTQKLGWKVLEVLTNAKLDEIFSD